MSFIVICDGLPDVYGHVSGLWGGETAVLRRTVIAMVAGKGSRWADPPQADTIRTSWS